MTSSDDSVREWSRLRETCRREARAACESLLGFRNRRGTFFYRSSDELQKGPTASSSYPTATFRCIAALDRGIREKLWASKAPSGFSEESLVRTVFSPILRRISSGGGRLYSSSLGERNVFTLSQFAPVPSALSRVLRAPGHKALDSESKLCRDLIRGHLLSNKGAQLGERDQVHAYLAFHALSALETLGVDPRRNAGLSPVFADLERAVYRSIAHHAGRDEARFDVLELAFAAFSVVRFVPTASSACIEEALRIVCERQAPDGSWAAGRALRYSGSDTVHVPSIEVALGLVETANRLFEGEPPRLSEDAMGRVLATVLRAFEFLERTRRDVTVSDRTLSGWGNDRARREDLVEAWTTAVAALFFLSFGELLASVIRQRVLRKYEPVLPTGRGRSWDEVAETDDRRKVKRFLKDMVIEKIKADWRSALKETSSLILFGPPGTAKTTIVKSIAAEIGWRLVVLSPGSFVTYGFDSVERRAREVFDDLLALERVVVLFDECDELFLKRPSGSDGSRSRTIGSFLTAAMLPRLQDLRDRSRVLFVLATNNYFDLDDAVKRPGRFDLHVAIGPPSLKGRAILLGKFLRDPSLRKFAKGLAKMTHRFTVGELRLLAREIERNSPSSLPGCLPIRDRFLSALQISEERLDAFLSKERRASAHVRAGAI